jgi:hypothetical protein
MGLVFLWQCKRSSEQRPRDRAKVYNRLSFFDYRPRFLCPLPRSSIAPSAVALFCLRPKWLLHVVDTTRRLHGAEPWIQCRAACAVLAWPAK